MPLINIQMLMEAFEKNYQSNPIVTLACINLLAEILQHDQAMSQHLILYFEKPHTYKILNELLNPTKKYNRIEEIRKIEGSNFGCPIYGFNDSVINLLQKLLVRPLQCYSLVSLPQGAQENG